MNVMKDEMGSLKLNIPTTIENGLAIDISKIQNSAINICSSSKETYKDENKKNSFDVTWPEAFDVNMNYYTFRKTCTLFICYLPIFF